MTSQNLFLSSDLHWSAQLHLHFRYINFFSVFFLLSYTFTVCTFWKNAACSILNSYNIEISSWRSIIPRNIPGFRFGILVFHNSSFWNKTQTKLRYFSERLNLWFLVLYFRAEIRWTFNKAPKKSLKDLLWSSIVGKFRVLGDILTEIWLIWGTKWFWKFKWRTKSKLGDFLIRIWRKRFVFKLWRKTVDNWVIS